MGGIEIVFEFGNLHFRGLERWFGRVCWLRFQMTSSRVWCEISTDFRTRSSVSYDSDAIQLSQCNNPFKFHHTTRLAHAINLRELKVDHTPAVVVVCLFSAFACVVHLGGDAAVETLVNGLAVQVAANENQRVVRLLVRTPPVHACVR